MSFDELSTKLKDTSGSGKNYKDERLWYPKLDDNKNGYAVIRFLPTSENDDLPFVKLYAHGFKGATGKWFFENCPTTLSNDCPVCAANREIVESHGGWETTPKHVKDGDIRNRKRKLSYYSNIYIVSDPATPENEGKVFIFKYGAKIFAKLMEASNPSFPDVAAIQPFDMWEGGNFKLKIRQVDKMTNYDSSSFEEASQFLATDEEMETVYKSQYTLGDFIEPKQFKEFNDLKKNFARVEGNVVDEPVAEAPQEEKSIADKPKFRESAPEAETAKVDETPTVDVDMDSDDDDAMKYFKALSED